MARNNTIHLWDNSWHVVDWSQNDSRQDPYGRKAKPLPKIQRHYYTLHEFSSATIGELMKSEDDQVIVFPNTFSEGNEELKDQSLFRVTEKDGLHIDSITTGNIVGFIGKGKEKGGLNIHIHSRFSLSNDKGKRNDFFLYYMLEKVMAINAFSYSSSSGPRDPQVFDFLLFFFPKLLKEALSQGMYKEYVHHEYNDASIRGAVDINRHIRRNIPANGRIAYKTREFSYDNTITQLIRHTIEYIRRKPFGKAILHNDPDTEGFVQQIILATPTFQVQKRQAIINQNLRPVTHPYYTKYTALQNLCLRILRYEKLSYGEARDKIHGILIDAAWLWEEYIAQVLAEGSSFKHYRRKDGFPLLRREDNGRQFQTIIPDYLDDSDPNNVFVADAKYIPLDRFDNLSADRAAAVYYKTIMYMYRFNSRKGFLFHPLPTGIDNPDITEYLIIDTSGSLYEVGLQIPLVQKDDYSDFKRTMKERENKMRDTIYEAIKK
jgi:5-methylcytosine-specific restriction endonuclease McrBC regulatory subunit McrC